MEIAERVMADWPGWVVLLGVVLLVACGPTTEEKLAMLDALRRETRADLIRQRGECQAAAHEFQGNREIVEACLETFRIMEELARQTNADLDRRRAEILAEGRTAKRE